MGSGVVQLVERLLLTTDIYSSNQDNSKLIYYQLRTKDENKLTEAGNSPILIKL